MKRSILTVFALTLIITPMSQAGVEPSPFNDFSPDIKKLYAIDKQLLSIGKRLDSNLNRYIDNQTAPRGKIGFVNSILAVDNKWIYYQ